MTTLSISFLLFSLSLVCLCSVSMVSAAFSWTRITETADWPARHKGGVECFQFPIRYIDANEISRLIPANSLASTGCPLVLWGGSVRTAQFFNDIWLSTNGGRNWFPVDTDSSYRGSAYSGYTIGPKGKMIKAGGVVQGTTPASMHVDTTSVSTGSGTGAGILSFESVDYTATDDPPIRSYPEIQFNNRGDLYIAGSDAPSRADVWRADPDLSSWTYMGDMPAARGAGALLFLGTPATRATDISQDRLVYIGGRTDQAFGANTVYLTIDSGVTWTNMADAPWSPRWNHNAEVTSDGLIVLVGGMRRTPLLPTLKDLNDAWLSGDGGWSWTECAVTPGARNIWVDREWPMTVFDGKGYLYVMGGGDYEEGEAYSDVWKSSISFTDISATQEACKLPSLPSGCSAYGLQCIPPQLKGGADTVISWTVSGISISCNACPRPLGSSSNNPIAIAFAVVFAVLFAVALLYLYWVYKRAKSQGETVLFGWGAPIPLALDYHSQTKPGTDAAAQHTNNTNNLHEKLNTTADSAL